ncbi:MAG: ABC transporter permease [Pyrinomonadaceae bacterium]
MAVEFGNNRPSTINKSLPTDSHVEKFVSSPDATAAGQTLRKRGGRFGQYIFWLQLVAFLLGLALLAFVIKQVGVQPIFDALLRIGFGFPVVLAIGGLRHSFRTIAMSIAVPEQHRRFHFLQVFSARLGGEAISFLTFTGPLLGEATKVALLRKRVPLAYGVPALIIDNLLYNLSVALFVLSGAVVMLAVYPLPSLIFYLLVGIAFTAACSLLTAVVLISRRVMPLSTLLSSLARLGLNRRMIVSRRKQVRRIESNVYDFYRTRRKSFLAMLAFGFLAHAASVAEVYVTLKLLDFNAPIQAAYAIESLTKVINLVFGFVPATIGVYEGGTEVILRTMGFAAATGVTLALVRKAGLMFWTGIGLLILIRRAVPSMLMRLAERHPMFQKLMDNLVVSNLLHRPARTAASVLGVAIGVLLIVFTVGLAHGVLRERGRREGNINAQIMIRASGSLGLTGSQHFTLPLSRAEEIAKIEGVRAVTPLGQNLIGSDSGFGSRMVEGVNFEDYARLTGIAVVEGRGLQSGDEMIVDAVWKEQRKAQLGSTVQVYDRPFRIVGVYAPPAAGASKFRSKPCRNSWAARNTVQAFW